MKSCLSIFATLLLASSTTHARPAWTENGHTKCPTSSSAVQFSRLFNNNIEGYLLTTNAVEQSRALKRGYEFDGIVARVFRTKQLSTVPLYHVLVGKTQSNFYTTRKHERDVALRGDARNNADMGIAAYVFPKRLCGSKPLYRLLNRATGDYFYTMDEGERNYAVSDQGYDAPDIAGFVLMH
ncbi:hypothetical protein C8F04DRAFT_1193500 [Mycena alexandri]|uniref:DUF5648 domain-containing protein n=1 Tax=Mycena alexandri TaxID=1745969 RepID=A0AAD6SBQ8_9AGAR|nr:hypothetical protein C8F04DRAFT_1193500 [Mycena alexandri]